jgi:hypothetical protein
MMHYGNPVQKCLFFWIARCCTVNIILSIVVGKEAIKLGTCLIWASTCFFNIYIYIYIYIFVVSNQVWPLAVFCMLPFTFMVVMLNLSSMLFCMQDIWRHIHSLMPMRDAAQAACVSHAFLRSWRCHPNLTFCGTALV